MLIPREMSQEECIRKLSEQEVGRVAISTPMGPRIYPVNYVVDGPSIVFRTSPYGTLGTYGWGLETAFEIDGIQPDLRSGWSVMVLGRGRLLDGEEIRELHSRRSLEPWAGGAKTLHVRLGWRIVTGRHIGDPIERRPGRRIEPVTRVAAVWW